MNSDSEVVSPSCFSWKLDLFAVYSLPPIIFRLRRCSLLWQDGESSAFRSVGRVW